MHCSLLKQLHYFCYLNYSCGCPGPCTALCGIQFRHVAGLHCVGNELTTERVTEFSHQKEEVLRPDAVMDCSTLRKDSNAIGMVTVTVPALKGSRTPGTHFLSCTHTHCCLLSHHSASHPHSCSSRVMILLPIRAVSPASYLKAPEALNLMESNEDVNINWTLHLLITLGL